MVIEMKVIVPVKEYPSFIECQVYEKDIFGHLKFLYRETYNKELVNIEIYKKLLRIDNTLEYLEKQLELLNLINDEESIKIIQTAIDKLTRDEVIL